MMPMVFSRAVWLVFFLIISGCTVLPRNSLDLFQRSMAVNDQEELQAVLAKASVKRSNDPEVNGVVVAHLRGTPYEMGLQHGFLLKKEVRACLGHVMKQAARYASFEMMDEVYDLMSPYIPLEEKEEMRGLAHGAGLPLRLVHWFHTIPAVSEYGEKERFSKGFQGTSCSNIMAFGKATGDGGMYQMRVLDWNRELGAQQWPVILVHEPDGGNSSATFSFAGFIGCVTGINEKQMAFGEMGYGNPDNETLQGIPFVFLFRKLMREADTLDQAVAMIKKARRTCSYVYLISDGKKGDGKKGDGKKGDDGENGLVFITDSTRVVTFQENTRLEDERDDDVYPAMDDVLYAGARSEELFRALTESYGRISPRVLMGMAKKISLSGNVQNVVFNPRTLETWSSYAGNDTRDERGKACNRKWFYFDLKSELQPSP